MTIRNVIYIREAEEVVLKLLRDNPNKVYYSRQIEVLFERQFYHWITNQAIRSLISDGKVSSEFKELANNSTIHLVWDKSLRYYKRPATKVIDIVNRYSDPVVSKAVGLNGEEKVAVAFARNGFVIIEKDGISYGIEVKNTLGYMDKKELDVKVDICKHLGIRPLFVVRMFPQTWVEEVRQKGGFSLIIEWQLYPMGYESLAKEIKEELGLKVDTPRAIQDGTMQRFINYGHNRFLE